jgi:ABC-type lipoprotein release transport system permease subunit
MRRCGVAVAYQGGTTVGGGGSPVSAGLANGQTVVVTVWVCARSQMRERAATWVAVILLIGILGAVVLAAAAGARRTASAYPRYLRASRGADLLISPDESGSTGFYRALARTQGAAVVAPVVGFGVAPVGAPHSPLLVTAGADGHFGFAVEKPKLVSGRMPRPSRPDEVLADTTAAHEFGLHAGRVLRLVVARSQEELPDPSRDPVIPVTVVGIGVSRDSVVPANALASTPTLIAGPALVRQLGPRYFAFDGAYVVLDRETSKAAFTSRVQRLARSYPETGGSLFVADEAQQAAKVEHAIGPQAVALALFAVLAAVIALFAVSQIVARQLMAASRDVPTLRALGLSRRRIMVIFEAQVAAAAICGAILAVGIAVLASPVMPIGPAALAEPDPGLAVDGLVLGVGMVALVALVVAMAAWPAWRLARAPFEDGAHEPVGLQRRFATGWGTRVGAPPTVSIGLGHAFDPGPRRSALPQASAVTAVVVAVAATAGALTFGFNLSRLVETPRLYGQSWDVTADAQFSDLPATAITRLLRHEPGVIAWTYGEHSDIDVAGQSVPTIGLVSGRGPLLSPTLITGRPAQQIGEIALGSKALAASHRQIGQAVAVALPTATGGGHSTQMRIVGQSIFPFFGRGSFTPTGLGVGAQVLDPRNETLNPGQPPGFNVVLVRVASGRAHDANVKHLAGDLVRTDLCGQDNQCSVTTAARPVDVLNYSRIHRTPLALALLLALLGVLLLLFTLVASVRQHRRDFAILRTLGFTRPQVSLTVAWQATMLVAMALAVGLPVGLAIGRWAWSIFATNLGVPAEPTTPYLALIISIPIALVLANVLAAAPGILAARQRPATALRTT